MRPGAITAAMIMAPMLIACAPPPAAAAPLAEDLASRIAPQLPGLLQTYKGLHAHPELSHHEEQTAALLAAELRKSGYTVAERIGRYPDATQAFGVVGILKNGDGPTLLIRADMDALPIEEETALVYASRVRTRNAAGQEVGVMHACGHDVHTTTLIGTARALAALKARWRGTLMLIGQPSEETVDGARAMLADRLYERFGTPDMIIGLHDTNIHAAGTVAVTSGPTYAGVTSIDVVMRGVGGHGAAPQLGKDPVVMSAQFINQIQTIVSRQENPRDPAVVTVGDIHGGTKRNIIPDEVKMELTTRAFSNSARQTIVEGVRRAAKGIALAAGVPEDRAPVVTVLEHESVPALYNDPVLMSRVKAALTEALGPSNVFDDPPVMVSEDVGVFGLDDHKIPVAYFQLGAMDPGRYAAAAAAGQALPGMHTSRFEPLPEPTLKTGVTAMTAVALALLKP